MNGFRFLLLLFLVILLPDFHFPFSFFSSSLFMQKKKEDKKTFFVSISFFIFSVFPLYLWLIQSFLFYYSAADCLFFPSFLFLLFFTRNFSFSFAFALFHYSSFRYRTHSSIWIQMTNGSDCKRPKWKTLSDKLNPSMKWNPS